MREGDIHDDRGITLARGGAHAPDVLWPDAMRYRGVYVRRLMGWQSRPQRPP